jgi:hypothetical protein
VRTILCDSVYCCIEKSFDADRFDETFESIDASVVKCLETLGANSSEFSSCVASTVVKEFDSLHTRYVSMCAQYTQFSSARQGGAVASIPHQRRE